MTVADGRSRLALGTVQFGLPYGATNRTGQVPAGEVEAILLAAHEHGVDTLDTAALYGESETVLGRALQAQQHLSFRIVTKTAKRLDLTSATLVQDAVRRDLEASLVRLGCARVHAILAHDSAEVLGPFGEARWRALSDARDEGLVERIGLSVYSGEDVDTALARLDPDLIQAPFNALDRRLIAGGQLGRLAASRTALHVRSVFLQGLLLQPAHDIEPRFAALAPHLVALDRLGDAQGVSRLALLMALVLEHESIERLVLGVTSAAEFAEIAAAEKAGLEGLGELEYTLAEPLNEAILNPSQWHLLP